MAFVPCHNQVLCLLDALAKSNPLFFGTQHSIFFLFIRLTNIQALLLYQALFFVPGYGSKQDSSINYDESPDFMELILSIS